jgi:nucleoside 2-deoxyribosyltransferase
MIVNYSDKPVIKGKKSIFLAGPTPRSADIETWRTEAIKILEDYGFDGVVYVPEREFDDRTFDYIEQVEWEREALFSADVIVFWIPREIKTMPGFTTNVEFGYCLGKHHNYVLYGRPDNSEKNRYLDWLYEEATLREPYNNLKELLTNAADWLLID